MSPLLANLIGLLGAQWLAAGLVGWPSVWLAGPGLGQAGPGEGELRQAGMDRAVAVCWAGRLAAWLGWRAGYLAGRLAGWLA